MSSGSRSDFKTGVRLAEIPFVDIAPLFAADERAREKVDREIARAAFEIGFMTITGHPNSLRAGPEERAVLLQLFDLPQSEQRRLWKRNFAPENTHLYRGWFPLSSSGARNREGFEIGPDILRVLPDDGTDDLLCEPTPLPDPALLPAEWLSVARAYYGAMESIGQRILASLSRSLEIDERIFQDAFDDGISTLRLLHYPKRPEGEPAVEDLPGRIIEIDGQSVELVARAHVDSGLLTVLAQCGVGGLQARHVNPRIAGNEWIDVPPSDDGFAINFGGLMEHWTGGRVKATEHRVVGSGQNRFSVPFFFEPRPSTRIAPLPIPGTRPFESFLYGDHLWATTTKFPENFGLAHLRSPRGT